MYGKNIFFQTSSGLELASISRQTEVFNQEEINMNTVSTKEQDRQMFSTVGIIVKFKNPFFNINRNIETRDEEDILISYAFKFDYSSNFYHTITLSLSY